MSYDVEDYGYDQAMKQLDKMISTSQARYNTYLEKLADSIVSEARSNLQNDGHVKTGDLVSSVGILSNDEGKEIVVGSRLPQADIIENGRPEVRPVNAKALHWRNDAGEDVFAKSSKAVEPSPWLLPACISQLRNLPRIWMEKEGQFVQESSS